MAHLKNESQPKLQNQHRRVSKEKKEKKLLPLTKLGMKKSGMNFVGHAKFYVIRASCIRSDAAKFQLKIKCACVILAFFTPSMDSGNEKKNELFKCSFPDICHVRKRNCELFWYWRRHKKSQRVDFLKRAVLTDTFHFTGQCNSWRVRVIRVIRVRDGILLEYRDHTHGKC